LEQNEELEALPFVKNVGSISADIKMGWRPKGDNVFVAPIPLYYDFGDSSTSGESKKQPIYLGPRFSNAIKVHQEFACITLENGQPSYTYKFPANILTVKGKKQPVPRPFVGMNQMLDRTIRTELIFDSSFESGNLDRV